MARDTLLFRRDEALRAGWLVVQSQVRRDLRAVLDALVPGERVWIFGSLTQPVDNIRREGELWML